MECRCLTFLFCVFLRNKWPDEIFRQMTLFPEFFLKNIQKGEVVHCLQKPDCSSNGTLHTHTQTFFCLHLTQCCPLLATIAALCGRPTSFAPPSKLAPSLPQLVAAFSVALRKLSSLKWVIEPNVIGENIELPLKDGDFLGATLNVSFQISVGFRRLLRWPASRWLSLSLGMCPTNGRFHRNQRV